MILFGRPSWILERQDSKKPVQDIGVRAEGMGKLLPCSELRHCMLNGKNLIICCSASVPLVLTLPVIAARCYTCDLLRKASAHQIHARPSPTINTIPAQFDSPATQINSSHPIRPLGTSHQRHTSSDPRLPPGRLCVFFWRTTTVDQSVLSLKRRERREKSQTTRIIPSLD